MCPKHNVKFDLRQNVESGEQVSFCQFCDWEEQRSKRGREDWNQAVYRVQREPSEDN